MRRMATVVLAIAVVCASQAFCSEADVFVNSYYGEYDAKQKDAGFPSKSLEGPKNEKWTAPAKANKGYKLGVLFPHMKDSYWIAVNYGIITEAEKLKVGIKLLSAGGYGEIDTQRKQFMALIREKVDGIILGAISYDSLDSLVKISDKKGIPVIEVINDIYAPAIKAKALVSFYDMGASAGEFVVKDAAGKDITVAFFPGPKNSGWAPDSFNGFIETVKKSAGKVRVLPPRWGDTGHDAQRKLIGEDLKKHADIDYIVGNAVAAEVAVDVLKETGRKNVKIVSTYIIPTIYEKVKQGVIKAAPSDLTVVQGKMSVDMMVRLLNGEKPGKDFPFRSGPSIPVVTTDNIGQYGYEYLFGSRDFKPVFELNAP